MATDAGYFALDMEGDIGWSFPGKEFAVVPFLGLGYRWWFRDIHEATAIDDAGSFSSTGPFLEPWSTLYAKMGLRGEYRPSGAVAVFVEAGGSIPSTPRTPSSVLSPTGRTGAFLPSPKPG